MNPSNGKDVTLKKQVNRTESLYIDAGVSHIRLRTLSIDGREIENEILPSNRDLKEIFAERNIAKRFGSHAEAPIFITGKLAVMVRQALGNGYLFLNAAAQWLAASETARQSVGGGAQALIEISASGYSLVGIDGDGRLKDDLLVLNPRCGAGSGVNIDRVLQKLGMERSEVDQVLSDYLGEAGRENREKISTRADRCGVFGASATISDKNQGIPLAVALATTLKSETLKVCRKLPHGFERTLMLGRFFNWQFVRDCAEDHLRAEGVTRIDYDPENSSILDSLARLVERVGLKALSQPDLSLLRHGTLNEFPPFSELLKKYSDADSRIYFRSDAGKQQFTIKAAANLAEIPLHIGLDVGSTMAKVTMANDAGELLYLDAYSNAGDTISTVKKVFSSLADAGFMGLLIRSIGITGSARYQVREALSRIYPELVSRISVLVENYAHAHGSIDQAREHLANLKSAGVKDLNEDFCILVDIGGEDTKISTLALKEAELFNNAMNIKCSAGTGSLMDTLSGLFGIPGAAAASQAAMQATRSFEINATCAVFLMENAQKLQAQGVPREEILASANWAIVENMARTLWSQLQLPANSVVLLHGQTMLSDPLPLAVTHRLQDYLGAPSYSLVPTFPGHRACIGLIRSLQKSCPDGAQYLAFSAFLDAQFEKRIIQCHGTACEDPEAVCNRTSLKCQGADGKQFTFTLGGCSAINELFAKAKDRKDGVAVAAPTAPVRDAYKEIWDYIDHQHPKSQDPRRLIIPRSFVVSEWAYFLSQVLEPLGIPVHVDNVREQDLTLAQPQFDIDSCAPHMGTVGQFMRLAHEEHGYILAVQIERLPTEGQSPGRTCTLNQGGVAVARGLAQNINPDARVHLFNLDLSELSAEIISDQLYERLQPIFQFYGITADRNLLFESTAHALAARSKLRAEVAEMAADFIEEALAHGQRVSLVLGREYLLNPGIYDSHVRRLLRDKDILAIPSYVLDVELDNAFSHIYWRNPHLIASILQAVAEKKLYKRVQQPRLAALFKTMESGEDLLPVVQISTFCCGPDSVTLPLAAELMKTRPFLLIQSDAIIKELAHLENRVNTYVRQLELGLHGKLKTGNDEPFDVSTLKTLENDRPLDPSQDVVYFPTLADNRVITSVLRGAGFTCIDNYSEGFDLEGNIKKGRKVVGDSVCAPMAGVYADLISASEDFAERKAAGDPAFTGKTRLLFFDNAGTGPCRQGQYIEMHKLSAWREGHSLPTPTAMPDCGTDCQSGCPSGSEAVLRFLVARETEGYNIGIEEWTLLRMYQAVVVQGVLQDMHFHASTVCRDNDEYQLYYADYLKMKNEVFVALESFSNPGKFGKLMSRLPGIAGIVAKYFAYRLHGKEIAAPISRFAKRWYKGHQLTGLKQKPISIYITGEVYMRVAQSEEIFRTILATLGFGRFKLEVAPIWSYLDYILEESREETEVEVELSKAAVARSGDTPEQRTVLSRAVSKLKRLKQMSWMLRRLLAQPFYDAAGLVMPHAANDCMKAAEEVLPTLRPLGELGPYLGEVLLGLRDGGDLFLNVAPTGCMVSSMGEVLSPRVREMVGEQEQTGRIQHLFSADGEINDELLAMALLKSLGPERFFVREGECAP